MPPLARITIDPSQFPGEITRELLQSLRTRKINHKFHYDSVKQVQKWLALHEAYSPARTDPNCAGVYEAGFAAAERQAGLGPVHVIGLGCGGGQKDTQLLALLEKAGRLLSYTPCDVSTAMVLVAREAALREISAENCHPVVCDLATVSDLRALLAPVSEEASDCRRLFTFFGMMPNFDPDAILPKLRDAIGPEDILLLSANLAPGDDYACGVQQVLPLYDNEFTRDWLLTFLWDLGVEKQDGWVRFSIEETFSPIPLRRIVAHFEFARHRAIQVGPANFEFQPGELIRLFFSYRHTPELMQDLLNRYGFELGGSWVTPSGEEGVFLARRNRAA